LHSEAKRGVRNVCKLHNLHSLRYGNHITFLTRGLEETGQPRFWIAARLGKRAVELMEAFIYRPIHKSVVGPLFRRTPQISYLRSVRFLLSRRSNRTTSLYSIKR
jgi:hypothetical protein